MPQTSISDLRRNMASYLEQIKINKKPLVFGNRNKREYLIIPYPNSSEDENIFEVQADLEDKMIMSEYYKGLENLMQDWNDDEHDNLFVTS